MNNLLAMAKKVGIYFVPVRNLTMDGLFLSVHRWNNRMTLQNGQKTREK